MRLGVRSAVLGLLLSLACAAPASAAGGSAWAAPFGQWGPVSVSDTAVAGSTGYKETYSWYVPNWSDGSACVQVRGYDSTGVGKWFGAGCGTSGSATVPWGRVLGNPRVRAKSLTYFTGVPVIWNH